MNPLPLIARFLAALGGAARRNLAPAPLAAVFLAAATPPAPAQNPDPKFYVFLCFGQSNMEGFPATGEIDKTAAERFEVLAAVDFPKLGRKRGEWYPAVTPLCRGSTGVCPADHFGRTLVAHLPKDVTVGVVNVAVAGCKIELFDKENSGDYAKTAPGWMSNTIKEYGGSPYARLVEMGKLAQKRGVIKGILLHQGESNTGDKTWPEKVKGVYGNLLRDLDLRPEAVPLLAGEVVHEDQRGVCAGMNTVIAGLPGVIPSARVVSSAGCECGPDRLHFTPAGYRELGKRYGEAMLPLLGVKVPVATEAEARTAGPATYCNPIPLPNYPVGRRARDATVGAPVPKDDALWLADRQQQFRELADVSALWHEGAWYLYPSVDMAWVSRDGGATWRHQPLNVRDIGYAPTVVRHKGKFLLMASDSPVYSADSPLGPFKELGPIKLPAGVPGQTDPMLFSDGGRLFYYWGCTPTEGIFGVELDADDPTRVLGKPARVIAFEPGKFPWQRLGDWNEQPARGWVEGAWMLKRNGNYYLTYAAAGTENRTYAVGCAVGKSPLGPFEPQKNNPVLRATAGLVTGTAHGCVAEGPHGALWAFYTVRAGVAHGFERRLGMDPARVGDDGELHIDAASSLPQRLVASARGAEPAGWLPLNAGPRTVGSSDAPNLSGRLAVDDDMRTWWQPAPDDKSPTLTSNLTAPGAVVRAVRVIWRDVGLDTKRGAAPGPFRYRVEVRTGAGPWATVLDRSTSTDDFLIDYRECPATPGTAARLVVVGAPAGITPAVAEFTVFGEVQTEPAPVLKDAAKGYFAVGTAGDIPGNFSEGELGLVRAHFGVVTPENCMKPKPVHPAEETWSFERPDALVKWCTDNKLAVHGHTLVWHDQTDDWFFAGGDKAVVTKRLKAHIATLVGRYKGKIQGWDVVNEAIGDNGTAETGKTENLRNSQWVRTVGPEFLTLAFKFAHDADPAAKLYYNDYNIEAGPKHESSMVLLRRLIKDGAPIHGVGIQGHWSTANVPYEAIDRAIRDYASLGLKVSITELDVTIRGASGGQLRQKGRPREMTPATPQDLRAQADAYAKLFAIFAKHKDVIERVTFWGLNDRRSWRYGQNPLLFDADNRPKPAYAAVVEALRQPAPAAPVPPAAPPAELPAPPTGFDGKRDGIERGAVETVEYESKAAGAKRRMLVYTPPGFSKDRKYPVLYLLHGGGDNETGWVKKGAADVILDNLRADNKAVPMIVVMPNGRLVKAGEPPAGPFAGYDAFEKDLLGDVIPYVEAHYPVKADREHRALAGLSMGGLQTLDAGLTHLDTFASLGVFSSGWFPDRREKFEREHQELLKSPETNKKLTLFWVANGKPDIAYQNNRAMLEMFDKYKLRYVYNEGKGGHAWDSWKNHLYVFAPLLFRDGK